MVKNDGIKYNQKVCSYCRADISEADFKQYDMCCKTCYETKLGRVKDLATKNIGVMSGEGGKVIPEETRSRKMGEERKRLDWVKEKERKLAS